MALLLVGLTGGLASGKSTVARRLAAAGFHVVDADSLIAGMHRPGGAGADAVHELFGQGFLRADGGTDTAAVARRIFDHPEDRTRLEAALHPLVRNRFAELARGGDGVWVLEATKLVESGLARNFDLVVTVEADPEIRIRRAVSRGLSESDARARVGAQTDTATRIAAADRVLGNGGTMDELNREIDQLVELLHERSGAD